MYYHILIKTSDTDNPLAIFDVPTEDVIINQYLVPLSVENKLITDNKVLFAKDILGITIFCSTDDSNTIYRNELRRSSGRNYFCLIQPIDAVFQNKQCQDITKQIQEKAFPFICAAKENLTNKRKYTTVERQGHRILVLTTIAELVDYHVSNIITCSSNAIEQKLAQLTKEEIASSINFLLQKAYIVGIDCTTDADVAEGYIGIGLTAKGVTFLENIEVGTPSSIMQFENDFSPQILNLYLMNNNSGNIILDSENVSIDEFQLSELKELLDTVQKNNSNNQAVTQIVSTTLTEIEHGKRGKKFVKGMLQALKTIITDTASGIAIEIFTKGMGL